MSQASDDLLHKALALPLDKRAELAAELLASLDGAADPEVDAAWTREIETRARRARDGSVEGIPSETVHEEARARIQSR